MDDIEAVRLGRSGDDWALACADEKLVADANAYLGYLADRNYSPQTIRTYGYGLLAFTRWLHASAATSIVDARGGQSAVGESVLDPGPGHGRADAVLRAAFVRGPGLIGHGCGHRRPVVAGPR